MASKSENPKRATIRDLKAKSVKSGIASRVQGGRKANVTSTINKTADELVRNLKG
jgi:hypothetical protein